MKQVIAMIHSLLQKRVLLLFVLALGLSTGPLWAADTKANLPKAKPADPAAAKVKEPPKEQAQDAKGADRFIDKDNNGVDDRHESKVIRSPDAEKPQATQKQVPPPAAPQPPPKAPPGR